MMELIIAPSDVVDDAGGLFEGGLFVGLFAGGLLAGGFDAGD
jgi:hypothetical protein